MPVQRLIDSNILIYALNQSHPGHEECATYLQKFDEAQTLFTISEAYYEIYHALTIYYGIDPKIVAQSLHALLESNLSFICLSMEEIQKSLEVAINQKLDLMDARIVHVAQTLKIPIIVTEDRKFGSFIEKQGLIWETPLAKETRQRITEWEDHHIPPKGLPRVLTYIYRYLQGEDKKIALNFKNATQQLEKLPQI